MIRGLRGVVPQHAMETGRFYMAPANRGENWLFQCIQTSEPVDDGFRRKALFLMTGGKPDLGLSELPYQTPVVALDDLHIRVDPTSLANSALDIHLQRGLFLVRGNDAILCALTDHMRGWTAINLSTGHTVATADIGSDWLSFNRWSLVTDDENGELTIASFGEEPSAT